MKLLQRDGRLIIESDCYRLIVGLETGIAELQTGAGDPLFDFLLDVQVKLVGSTTQVPLPLNVSVEGSGAVLYGRGEGPWGAQRLVLTFAPDWFEISYRAEVSPGCLAVPHETRYFLRGTHGMQLKHCIEGFQPTPEGGKEAEDCYRTLFPRCSAGSYFTPPPLVLFQHLPAGWVGMGLTTLPSSKHFELESSRSLLVDTPGGHRVLNAGEVYEGPGVTFLFPRDGWSGVRDFHDILEARGLIEDPPIWERAYPDWWKRPIYNTYGDQMMELQYNEYSPEDWGAPGYTEDWVRQAVLRAEERLQYTDFTVTVDAFWQRPWDADPTPSNRFAHLRQLNDWLHDRGHKVLLWIAPFVTNVSEGRGTLAACHDLLERPVREDRAALDFTGEGFASYAEQLAERLFGRGPDSLDADGVKMDGLSSVRDPRHANYRDPEAGMGVREVMRFLEVFVTAARRVKPDVCINFSACDPRFAPWVSMNRLHDIHSSVEERERRARISAQAAPNLLIDTDGFVMYTSWVAQAYLAAAVYGTLTFGYSNAWHDGVHLTDRQMATLGKISRLSSSRPWGQPEFVEYGRWRLRHRDRIVAECFNGRALVLFPNESTGHVITFDDVEVEVCTSGRLVTSVSPSPERLVFRGDQLSAFWQGGQLYTLAVTG